MSRIPVYYYSSVSSLTRLFAERIALGGDRPVFDLANRTVRSSEAPGAWVLLTPSYKAGNAARVTVPAAVRSFLRSPVNRRRMVGIIGSGNRNFGEYYQAAARQLARVSARPVLFEFELSGTRDDVDDCIRILAELDQGMALKRLSTTDHPGHHT